MNIWYLVYSLSYWICLLCVTSSCNAKIPLNFPNSRITSAWHSSWNVFHSYLPLYAKLRDKYNLNYWRLSENFLRMCLDFPTNAKQLHFLRQQSWDVQLNVMIHNPSDGETRNFTAELTVIQIWAWVDSTANISPSQGDNVRFVWDPMGLAQPQDRYLPMMTTLQ